MARSALGMGILILCILGGNSCRHSDEYISMTPISSLIRSGEIPNHFFDEKDCYFLNIDDIVCDDDGNLYVADSGWNKIFKFDSQGRFLKDFGQAGQGPGEFLGQSRSKQLRMAFGNDQNLYILDPGNQRISMFSKEGRFLKQTRLKGILHDSPQINSKGDMFLISKSGKHVVDCYDSEGRFKAGILDFDDFYQYLFFSEPDGFPRNVNNRKLLKSIGPDDQLFIVSNLSLTVFQYDRNFRLENHFRIKSDRILEDFRARLKSAVSKGGYAQAFIDMHFEKDKNLLWLIYFNGSLKRPEVYRYTREGLLTDIMIFPDDYLRMFEQDNMGRVYAVRENELGMDTIVIYTIPKKGGEDL